MQENDHNFVTITTVKMLQTLFWGSINKMALYAADYIWYTDTGASSCADDTKISTALVMFVVQKRNDVSG